MSTPTSIWRRCHVHAGVNAHVHPAPCQHLLRGGKMATQCSALSNVRAPRARQKWTSPKAVLRAMRFPIPASHPGGCTPGASPTPPPPTAAMLSARAFGTRCRCATASSCHPIRFFKSPAFRGCCGGEHCSSVTVCVTRRTVWSPAVHAVPVSGAGCASPSPPPAIPTTKLATLMSTLLQAASSSCCAHLRFALSPRCRGSTSRF